MTSYRTWLAGWLALLIWGQRNSGGDVTVCFRIRTPLRRGPCKEPSLSGAGGVLLPLLTQKLPGQVPSGVDPGQPLLPDAPSELPLLLSDAEVTQAAAERSGMCVWEGEKDVFLQAQIPHNEAGLTVGRPRAVCSLGQGSHHHQAIGGTRDAWGGRFVGGRGVEGGKSPADLG